MADTTDDAGTPTRSGRGVQRRVTDATGQQYLLQAAPSGHFDWPVYGPQGVLGLVVQTAGTAVVNWLVFWGSWRVTEWQGDRIAPKRTKISTTRYRTAAEAVAALHTRAAGLSQGTT